MGDVVHAINSKSCVGMSLAELGDRVKNRPSIQISVDRKDSLGIEDVLMHRND